LKPSKKEKETMNIYQTMTDRIMSQLAAGVVPWRKTWTAGLPKSLTTRKEYRGVNILVLGFAEFTSRYWVTYRQALQLGGHVRKGERATPVIYWKWRTAEDLKRLEVNTGRQNLAPCYPFTSAVFNLDQVEGVARPQDDVPAQPNGRFESAEQLINAMPNKPEIVHGATREPVYYPDMDRVALPHIGQFENADEYYAALFHELAHSTGHVKRLNRGEEAQGDRLERYSFEELVAEFAAAFLCACVGINNPDKVGRQADYIDGWSKIFQKDTRIIVRAASAAQRAADYIRGIVAAESEEATPPAGAVADPVAPSPA
jgi:antirestriction protein ArdC